MYSEGVKIREKKNYEEAITLKNNLEKIKIKDLEKKGDLYSSAAFYFGCSEKYSGSIELMKIAIESLPQNGS